MTTAARARPMVYLRKLHPQGVDTRDTPYAKMTRCHRAGTHTYTGVCGLAWAPEGNAIQPQGRQDLYVEQARHVVVNEAGALHKDVGGQVANPGHKREAGKHGERGRGAGVQGH